MATFRTEFLPPSNRRRCVKGRSSYTDSSDLYLPAAVNQDQNSNGFSQNEDSYIDSVRSDDGEEEDITIDLSAFLNANPLFAQAAFESASENNIASTESSSQFRFTDCKVDPSEIPKAAVTNPLLSVDVNGDSSVGSNITNENIVGPHAAVTFIHDTKENCLSPEKMLINLTNNEPAQSVTLNGKKTVLSPTKKFSRALGLSNPLNKNKNFMKSKDLNKVNEKVFGKYPIVKCEKLDIENFVKNNEIKIRNWPLLQTESKKSNSVYKGTIKRKVNLNKGNLKPKFMKKPINFNKYLIASNKGLANQNISNILGDQPDVSKPIIIKTDSWKPGVTNVSSCVPSFFRPLTKTSLSTSKNVECDLLKLNDKTVGLNVISSPEKKCDIRAKAVATNINKLFNSPKSYPLIAPKPCSSSKVHRKINQEKLLKEVVPKVPVVLKVKDVSSEESASVLKPKDIVLEVMQNVFSSTQSKKFPKKSVKKPTCDLTSGNSIIGSSAFSSILNYNILNGFSENDFEDVSLLYDDNFTDSTQEMSPPSKSLPDKVNVVTEDSGLTPKSIKKAREQKKYKRKKFSDNSPEINSTLSASEYESEDKLEKVKRAVISHEDNTENIKSSTVNISVHSKNFNEPVNKDFETKHVDTSLLFSNFESHISESQDSVSCNKLVSPKIVEQTEVPLSSFNEIVLNVNSPVKKCKENDNLVKQETSTSTLQEDNVKNSGNSESLIEENNSADIEVSSYLPHKDLKDTMLSSADEIKNSVNDSDSCESLIKENNSTVTGVLPALEVENSKDIRLSVADSVELINKTHSFSNINDSSDILNENLHNIWDVTFDSTVNQTNENEFEETENTLEENIAVNPEMSVENEIFEDFVHEETVIEEVVTMEICDEFEQMSGNPDVSICVDDEENKSIPSIDSPEESASNPSITEDFSLDFGDDLVIPKIEKTTVPVIPEEDVTPKREIKITPGAHSAGYKRKSNPVQASTPSSSRKKNYDPELVCLPFSMGWMREQVIRATGKAKNHQSDVYYFSPEGTKLRSMPDILVYLSSHPHIKLSAVNFTFAKELIYHEPFETKREAKQPSWAKKTPSKALISHGDCGKKIAKRRACSKIGNKSGACANNVNMSPKVVLQKMEEIPLIYCDSLSYSGGHNVKLYQSKKTCAKPSKSIDSSDTVKSGKVLSSEAVPVAGSSKQVTERPENPPVTVKECYVMMERLEIDFEN